MTADWERCWQAAEELSTLGYAAESRSLSERALTQLASEVPSLRERVQTLIAERAELGDRAFRERARSLASEAGLRGWTLGSRAWLVVTAGLFALTALTFFVRLARPYVLSSADYSPAYAAEHIRDGDLSSEWLLPDHATGFVELALPAQRSLTRITLVNGHNAPHEDRAVRRARVVLYDDDREVASAEVTFSGIVAKPERRTVDFASKPATRVRIEVHEHVGLGSALAEVQLE